VHTAAPRFRARLCLEATAGQGVSIGWRFEHLADILASTRHPERLGVCLDTCHLFAAGYDLSTRGGYEEVMSRFDALVGLSRVRCFHLNDCKKPLGCRVDRHAHIGEGAMGLTAFRCLVNDPRFAETIGVLETPDPGRYGESIRLLESMRRK
jgi:deoxyribonuclease IV